MVLLGRGLFYCISVSLHRLPKMDKSQANKTILRGGFNSSAGCHEKDKNASCSTEIGPSYEECEINVAVVIIVILVIVGWFIGYLFLQKVQEKKEEGTSSTPQKRRNFKIP